MAIYLGFLALSAMFCRRFFDLFHPNTNYIMEGDPALNAWALDWVTHALKTNPLAILNGNAFFPYPRSILLSEHMLSLAFINVFTSPFAATPWLGYNFLVFLSYLGSAIGGFLLIREWTGSTRAGIWAGVFWGFLFFRVHHISHLQILSFEWVPFCALFLVKAEREPSVKNWGAFTFFFLLQALVSWYLAVITISLLVVVAACTVDGTMFDRRHVLSATAAMLLCVAPLAALAIPYAAAGHSSTLGQRYGAAMSEANGVNLRTFFAHFLFPPDATLIGSRIPGNRHWVWGENTLYIGYVPLLLAAVALIGRPPDYRGLRLTRMGIALVVVGVILAVGFISASGVKLPLYYLALAMPIVTSLRATQRFSLLIYFGVMLLSSLSIERIDHRSRKPRVPSILLATACAVFLIEVYPVKLPYDGSRQKFEYSAIDRGIDKIQNQMGRHVAVIHYPIHTLSDPYPTAEAAYMVGSTLHHADIVNGFSGAEPNGWMEDLRTYNEIPDERAFALLKQRHIDLICLHPDFPVDRRQLIVRRFRQLALGDVVLFDDAGNVILRLN